MTIPSKEDLIELYRKRAKNYDITANLYYLIGFREWIYRKMVIGFLISAFLTLKIITSFNTYEHFELLKSQHSKTAYEKDSPLLLTKHLKTKEFVVVHRLHKDFFVNEIQVVQYSGNS